MNNNDEYITLISSLPSPQGLFEAKVPPLSRIKLERRLQVLSAEHKQLLNMVENILDWRQYAKDIEESEIIARGKALFSKVKNRTLRRLIQERLEIRTLLSAMRLKHKDLPAPQKMNWGFGRWQQHIVRHWHEPGFQLGNVYDWAIKAQSLLEKGHSFELEKLLLEVSFRQLQRHGSQHLFDFEAVVIYVMKWNIVNRSVQYNSHLAARRFDHMLDMQLNHKLNKANHSHTQGTQYG